MRPISNVLYEVKRCCLHKYKKQEKKMKYLKRNKNKIEIVKECEKSKKFNDE